MLFHFLVLLNLVNGYLLIKQHSKTIKWLNDNNPETLRNYQVHNPLIENNENVSNSIILLEQLIMFYMKV